MSEQEIIIESYYDRSYTYTVVLIKGLWGDKYKVRKNGSYIGTFKSRADAVARAKKLAGQ